MAFASRTRTLSHCFLFRVPHSCSMNAAPWQTVNRRAIGRKQAPTYPQWYRYKNTINVMSKMVHAIHKHENTSGLQDTSIHKVSSHEYAPSCSNHHAIFQIPNISRTLYTRTFPVVLDCEQTHFIKCMRSWQSINVHDEVALAVLTNTHREVVNSCNSCNSCTPCISIEWWSS